VVLYGLLPSSNQRRIGCDPILLCRINIFIWKCHTSNAQPCTPDLVLKPCLQEPAAPPTNGHHPSAKPRARGKEDAPPNNFSVVANGQAENGVRMLRNGKTLAS
jgi:hypothetical protein